MRIGEKGYRSFFVRSDLEEVMALCEKEVCQKNLNRKKQSAMLKKTPLYREHTSLGARMRTFGGWTMPIEYEGILIEHKHTRTRTGLFDICHMGEFELTGPTTAADLEMLLTMPISTLRIGQCRYGFMLNEQGGVIDDLICYRLGKERYMLVVNAARIHDDAVWIESHLSSKTIFVDRSVEFAKFDVQGPSAHADLEEVFEKKIPILEYFRAEPFEALGIELLISRTGYTGEWGYELYFPIIHAVRIWRTLLKNRKIKPVGLGARNTLRLEMGYSLYGHELSLNRTPGATSRGLFIKKEIDFIGRNPVFHDIETPSDLLVALVFENKHAARAGDKVFLRSGKEDIGIVTSGSVSPSLGKAIALAFVKADVARQETVLDVEVRGRNFPAKVTEFPFYRMGTAKGSFPKITKEAEL